LNSEFHFRFERLLELRRRTREQREKDLRSAKLAEIKARRHLLNLARAHDQPALETDEPDSGAGWSRRQRWRRLLAARRNAASERAEQLAQEANARADILRRAWEDEAAFVRLRDRWREQHEDAARRRSQKELDQHARTRPVRRRPT